MSALLTTTMPYMKVVIDTLKEKGLRKDIIVLVGGAPLNEAFAEGHRGRRLLPRRRGGGRDGQEVHAHPQGRSRTPTFGLWRAAAARRTSALRAIIDGAPELIVEIAISSASYDYHVKRRIYIAATAFAST
jgi:hypothetical protein